MRGRLRAPSVAAVAGGGLALWGLAIGVGPLGDNSFLTQLATGRVILDHGIPRRDPFSFTAGGQPWVVYSWLPSAGVALLERLGGGHAVQLARAVLTTGLALIAWRLSRPADALAGRILATVVVVVVGSGMWAERPLLLALVLFAVLVWLVERDRGPAWTVVPLFWLWVNVHGSFPLGAVYLLVRLVGRRIDGSALGRLPALSSLAVVGILAGGLNPLGPKLIVFPLRLLGRHELLERVVEWRPADFSDPVHQVFLLAFVAALVLAARRRSWEDVLPVAVFGMAAFVAQRNLSLASLVLVPVLARGLSRLGSVEGRARSGATVVAALAVVATAGALVVGALQRPAYDLGIYPVAQLRWMEQSGLLDQRVATQDFVGNLIVARRGERADIFFDDRYDLYPAAVINDYLGLLDGREGWQRRLDRYGIDVVLWERSRPLAGLLSLDPGWEVVRRDRRWIVAVRAGLPVGPVRPAAP